MRPLAVTLDKQSRTLIIRWQDGVTCHYPWAQLREACPCVACRGGHRYMGRAHEPQDLLELRPARSWQLVSVDFVGSYALQPGWDDGHATGIYSWAYLRRLCPPAGGSDEEGPSGQAGASGRGQ